VIGILKRVFDVNERELARLRPIVEQVNALEPEMEALSDGELYGRTDHFRHRLEQGETLDDILPEAFAVVREGSKRVLGMRPFDVQVMGAAVLHQGKVAEMKTGEGKTLTATMPLYLNALAGRGAHLVTTNDFLVRWQAEWMGRLYEFLGLTVGHIQHGMNAEERRAMYLCDITYVENSELGFDYLRDNMAGTPERLVLRDLYYAIIDEVDSILIDEARTPLIISGTPEQSEQYYEAIDQIVRRLQGTHEEPEEGPDGRKIEPDADYMIDEKFHQVALTARGQQKVERALGIDNLENPEYIEIKHHVQNSLKAHGLYHIDDDYVVVRQEGEPEVVIVDELTGHLQPGRRYADGLHQAIEAKEGVRVQQARQTVASITYQNFFKLYDKLAGMTGTAKTEEDEFRTIYGMPVVVIPTNRPVVRIDHPDVVFKTEEAKFRGVVNEIIDCFVREQPTLVGSRSVDVSERISARMSAERLNLHTLAWLGLDELHNGARDLDKQTREEYFAALRTPIPQMSRAETVKILRALEITPDPLAPENIDRMLRLVGSVDENTDESLLPRYRDRLHQAISEGIPHNVLNAKQHEREGQIIAEAGRRGAVTIATNMAGRGVDIVLGGKPDEGEEVNPEEYEFVKSVGGLHVLGSERHESRRIDNQLRGRSGRQGDPGSSRFYVSLEDELMRLFAPDRFSLLMGGWPEEEAIEARLVSRSIERAQEKVEARNFDMRKNTLKYDDVMNVQRSLIYDQRRRVLEGEDIEEAVLAMVEQTVQERLETFGDPELPARWAEQVLAALDEAERQDELTEKAASAALQASQVPGIEGALPAAELLRLEPFDRRAAIEDVCQHIWLRRYHSALDEAVPGLGELVEPHELEQGDRETQAEMLKQRARELYDAKEQAVGSELMRRIERSWLLRIIDMRWMQHLKDMDFLREGIYLRAYGQRDPLLEYTKEAHALFQSLLQGIAEDMTRAVLLTEVAAQQQDVAVRGMETGQAEVPDAAEAEARAQVQAQGEDVATPMTEAAEEMTEKGRTYVAAREPGRNDPCPCGSGKKYKHCCLGK